MLEQQIVLSWPTLIVARYGLMALRGCKLGCLHTLTATVFATLLASTALAQQEYPARSIRIINPFAPGTGYDGIARVLSQRFIADWGQPAVLENRAGAGGIIGAEAVAKSAPDGYTLLVSTASLAVNATLMPKLPFDVRRDLVPITEIVSSGVVIVVHPSVPARNLKELLALAKSHKDGLNFGSNGTGTTSHLAGAWLQQLSGLNFTHIPYKGQSLAFTAVIGGEVEIALPGSSAAVQGMIATKKLRGIAVTMLHKSKLLPDLPLVASVFPGFEVDNWFAMWAPAGTTPAITNKLHAQLVKSLQHPDMRPALQGDIQVVGSSPMEFAAYLNREIDKYAKIIKASGAKPDA